MDLKEKRPFRFILLDNLIFTITHYSFFYPGYGGFMPDWTTLITNKHCKFLLKTTDIVITIISLPYYNEILLWSLGVDKTIMSIFCFSRYQPYDWKSETTHVCVHPLFLGQVALWDNHWFCNLILWKYKLLVSSSCCMFPLLAHQRNISSYREACEKYHSKRL
jgi:hypothetical protein